MDDMIEELRCISNIKPGETYSPSTRECILKTSWSTSFYKRVYGTYEHREQMVASLKRLQLKIEVYPYDIRDIRNKTLVNAIVSATLGLNNLADNYYDDKDISDQIRDISAGLLIEQKRIWDKYIRDVEITVVCTPPLPPPLIEVPTDSCSDTVVSRKLSYSPKQEPTDEVSRYSSSAPSDIIILSDFILNTVNSKEEMKEEEILPSRKMKIKKHRKSKTVIQK